MILNSQNYMVESVIEKSIHATVDFLKLDINYMDMSYPEVVDELTNKGYIVEPLETDELYLVTTLNDKIVCIVLIEIIADEDEHVIEAVINVASNELLKRYNKAYKVFKNEII